MAFSVTTILDFAKTFGDPIIKKVYGDIPRTIKGCENFLQVDVVRKELAATSFDIEDIPYIQTKKNSADIALAIGALVACQQSMLDTVIVVSTDKDFIPLYKALRERSVSIIVLSIDKEFTNVSLLENHVTQLCYYSDLNIPMDASLTLKYKNILQTVLKIMLPSTEEVIKILSVAYEIYKQRVLGDITLNQWVTLCSQQSSLDPNLIFRILLSVYFGRCFRSVVTPTPGNDPIIQGFVEDNVESMLRAFLRQMVSILRRSSSDRVDLQAAAELFGISQIELMEILQWQPK
jgi:hypothetical protein